jgi:hypothetical protein
VLRIFLSRIYQASTDSLDTITILDVFKLLTLRVSLLTGHPGMLLNVEAVRIERHEVRRTLEGVPDENTQAWCYRANPSLAVERGFSLMS